MLLQLEMLKDIRESRELNNNNSVSSLCNSRNSAVNKSDNNRSINDNSSILSFNETPSSSFLSPLDEYERNLELMEKKNLGKMLKNNVNISRKVKKEKDVC
jgi:hypothetical protein